MIGIAQKVEDVYLFRDTCVIIDFFRFSTTIAALVWRNKNILVFSDEGKILGLSDKYTVFSEKILDINKFDNSPYLAYTQDFNNDVIVLTESGSKAIMACKNAQSVIIASFSNIDCVKQYLKNKSEILIIPACIFFNKDHKEDFIFSRYFLSYLNNEIDLDVNSVYNEIYSIGRIDELIKQRKTALEDIKLIFSPNIFGVIPIAKILNDFAEVRDEKSSC
ncbi:MAG: 2-phosphosulfolactate phosphatase [Elusimicrobiales bacterium]|nr:2-phosphosulfolactate phosphatase [Elusimicrobiales bacterium]